VAAEEAEARAVDAQDGAVGPGRGLGEGDLVAGGGRGPVWVKARQPAARAVLAGVGQHGAGAAATSRTESAAMTSS
jgi:hypothetical protein